jgi:hypothetical protein
VIQVGASAPEPAGGVAVRPVATVAALAALGGAAFCFVTGENLPVGLLPQLSAGLHVSLSAVGLLVTIYALVVVAVSAPLTHLTRGIARSSPACWPPSCSRPWRLRRLRVTAG